LPARHHPPDIRVRDFGSRNGTFVNGNKIGQRGEDMTPEEGARIPFPEFDLKAGDEIRLGETVFRVGVFVPALCADCSAEIAEDQKAAAEKQPGVYLCEACRRKRPDPSALVGLVASRNRKACAQCGKDVTSEMGEHRHGAFICSLDTLVPLEKRLGLLQTEEENEALDLHLNGGPGRGCPFTFPMEAAWRARRDEAEEPWLVGASFRQFQGS
jgi:hypothetical protein